MKLIIDYQDELRVLFVRFYFLFSERLKKKKKERKREKDLKDSRREDERVHLGNL